MFGMEQELLGNDGRALQYATEELGPEQVKWEPEEKLIAVKGSLPIPHELASGGITLRQLGSHTVRFGTAEFEKAEAETRSGLLHRLEQQWGDQYHLNYNWGDTRDLLKGFVRKQTGGDAVSYTKSINSVPLYARTFVSYFLGQPVSETIDCIKAAVHLYGVAGPFFMLSVSLPGGDIDDAANETLRASVNDAGFSAWHDALFAAGEIKEMLVIHPDTDEPLCNRIYPIGEFISAMQAGISVRHVGLLRVLRRVRDLVDTAAMRHGPLTSASDIDVIHQKVEQFGGHAELDLMIKDGIEETLRGLKDLSMQKINGTPYGPEDWGMTMSQLKELHRIVQSTRAADVKDRWTMNDVVKQVIIPQTRGRGVGWALLQNMACPLRPEYLISHTWSEFFDEFINATIRTDGLRGDSVLWICAAALYQCNDHSGPSISDQLGLDVKEGPFAKILALRNVRMIAVHTSAEDLYARLWCLFEFWGAEQGGVQTIFAGDAAVIELQGNVNSRSAVCGPPQVNGPGGRPFMIEDTRKIRTAIEVSMAGERSWGSKPPPGTLAYDKLNRIIASYRKASSSRQDARGEAIFP